MEKLKNLKGSVYSKALVAVPCILATTSSLAFAADASDDLTAITSQMTGIFSSVKSGGIAIMSAAIGLGMVFLGGGWLYGKTKQWLKKS